MVSSCPIAVCPPWSSSHDSTSSAGETSADTAIMCEPFDEHKMNNKDPEVGDNTRSQDVRMHQDTSSGDTSETFDDKMNHDPEAANATRQDVTKMTASESRPSGCSGSTRNLKHRTTVLAVLFVIVIGAGVSAAFVGLGVRGAFNDQRLRFEKQAFELVKAVETTWKDYELAGLWVHEACRSTGDYARDPGSFSICSREDFRELYEYVVAGGLKIQYLAFNPNVTDEFRTGLESEATAYYDEFYPDLNYLGFVESGIDVNNTEDVVFLYRSQQEFYFPHHLVEPVVGNEWLLDFDMYSTSRSYLIDQAVTTWTPILSRPYFQPPDLERSVMLLHPGVKVSTLEQERSTGLSSVVVVFSALIERVVSGQSEPVSIYIYDTTDDGLETVMFGGAHVDPQDGGIDFTFVEDIDLSNLRKSTKASRIIENDIAIERQTWTVVVVAREGTYEPELRYIILGGVLVFVACVCLALWFHSKMRREAHVAEIKNAAEAEKALLIVENAKQAAKSERELNDYIAHEVRNPLTSAMSACSFLSSAHQEKAASQPHMAAGVVIDEETQLSIQEDINVISSSLEYINDLLRSMLDMHKISSNQITLETSHTDILQDIFEPVKTILHRRDNMFNIIVECDENLVVEVDRMRLKQIVLNLAVNSKKFVQKGYIRLRAVVGNDDKVQISLEDSGPGIPEAKQSKIFSRFQDSLDTLNQGTGMGLSLCKSLIELMGGSIMLDTSFDSGVEGFPGTRFVIYLNASPLQLKSSDLDQYENLNASLTSASSGGPLPHANNASITSQTSDTSNNGPAVSQKELPEKLSVLIVDDDLVLRKLLSRSLKRVAPGWTTQEAANGETALVKVDSEEFDLIFLDQYMASVEKQLLGTETAHALRAKGVTCQICGLSANDLEEAFLKSGGNSFMLKPFPCKKEELTLELLRVIYGEESVP